MFTIIELYLLWNDEQKALALFSACATCGAYLGDDRVSVDRWVVLNANVHLQPVVACHRRSPVTAGLYTAYEADVGLVANRLSIYRQLDS